MICYMFNQIKSFISKKIGRIVTSIKLALNKRFPLFYESKYDKIQTIRNDIDNHKDELKLVIMIIANNVFLSCSDFINDTKTTDELYCYAAEKCVRYINNEVHNYQNTPDEFKNFSMSMSKYIKESATDKMKECLLCSLI